jgi:1-deoxy-D-xylulose-5-phosphate reductoisomerase
LPAVFNAANEVAVEAFCNRHITFDQIPAVVAETMKLHEVVQHPSLEQILAADAWARGATLGKRGNR